MKFAICGLGWNASDITQKWLYSIHCNSSNYDYKLYLMDNGSTDNTSDIMKSFNPHYFRKNLTNDSIYKGWNELAKQALHDAADIIILSNNDIIVGPNWLAPIEREMSNPKLRYFLPNGQFKNSSSFINDIVSSNIPPGTRHARGGWCLILPAAAIDKFWPIPEELILWYGDDYIHWKLADAGYSCEAIDDCFACHLGSVSFYARENYVKIVAKDLEVYNSIVKKANRNDLCL